MITPDLTVGPDALELRWADGAVAYPAIWLRDNCPSGLHPQTRERISDILDLPEEPRICAAHAEAGFATIEWDDGHVSRFALDWLDDNRPGRAAPDPGVKPPETWRSAIGPAGIPRHSAGAILASDEGLAAWMEDTARLGITIVVDVPGTAEGGMAVAKRIAFLRPTNFGVDFEVINKPDPNNLAYTAEALPMHTDLPNQELPPGYQFLHAIANEAVGGGSILIDGFAIAEDMRAEDPEAYKLLSEVSVPFRFHDDDTDLRARRPVFAHDHDGNLLEVSYSAHLRGPFDMPADVLPAYYRAFRAFVERTRSERYRVTLKLKAGEMLSFDNRRILHGRDRFDPNTGFRHLHGFYVDRGEFASRLRVLARRRREEAVETAA